MKLPTHFNFLAFPAAQHFCRLALYMSPLYCGFWIMAILLFCFPYVPIHSRPFHYIQSRSFTQLVWITPDCRMPRGNVPVPKTGCANSSRISQTKLTVSKSRLPRERIKCKFCKGYRIELEFVSQRLINAGVENRKWVLIDTFYLGCSWKRIWK